jgi:MFS family permease
MKILSFKRQIRILLLTDGLAMVAAAMLAPIYAIFVERIGGDLLDASLTVGIFAFFAALTSFFAGKYADRIEENELILVLGYGLMGIGFFLYLFINTVWQLFLIQALIGIAGAVASPAFDVLYTKHLREEKAGRTWGSWEALNYLTTAFGAVIGGLIVANFGFNVAFIFMTLLCFVSAIYIYILPRKVL